MNIALHRNKMKSRFRLSVCHVLHSLSRPQHKRPRPHSLSLCRCILLVICTYRSVQSMYQSKCFSLNEVSFHEQLIVDTDRPTSLSTRPFDQYETILSSASPPRTPYENDSKPVYASFQSSLPSMGTASPTSSSRIPPFQRKLPIFPVLILGLLEVLGGLAVMILEILVFDIAIGLWCGLIYALAGAAAIVFGTYHRASRALLQDFSFHQ